MKKSFVFLVFLISCGQPSERELDSAIYNTFIGHNAGANLTVGDYNFVVGEDSTAVNVAPDCSYFWYIQPTASYFETRPKTLACFLSVYPHTKAFMPKDKAEGIIARAKLCLNIESVETHGDNSPAVISNGDVQINY